VSTVTALHPEEWAEPAPLAVRELPELPEVPGLLGDTVDTIATATQVPRDYVLLAALTATSAATRGRTELIADPVTDWRETLSLYTMPLLPSSTRKSQALRLVTKPLTEWERQEVTRWVEEGGKHDLDIAEANLERAKKSATKDGADYTTTRAEIESASDALDKIRNRRPQRLLADDITPEALMEGLRDHGGLGILSAEGGLVGTLAGRYSNGKPNLDAFLKAWSGEPIRMDRRGGEPVYIPRAFLAVCIGAQPDVLREMREEKQMTERGALPRFLLALPASGLGTRTATAPALNTGTLNAWSARLLRIVGNVPPLGELHPLNLTPEARALLLRFTYDELEPRLSEDADLGSHRHMQAWAGKLAGNLARVAALTALIEDPTADDVDAEAMEWALGLSDYFIAHAWAAHRARTEKTPAERVHEWLTTHRPWDTEDRSFDPIDPMTPWGVFTSRAVYLGVDRQTSWVRSTEDVKAALRDLADLGWVRPYLPTTRGKGRPSDMWQVHPSLREERA
jgi:replicative DNA helicase